jgi:hypothetical protein
VLPCICTLSSSLCKAPSLIFSPSAVKARSASLSKLRSSLISQDGRDGNEDGLLVGASLGLGEGKILGSPVGISLGERVGLWEGDTVGNRLGEGDGISVGALEGLLVGCSLGRELKVGKAVGKVDGLEDVDGILLGFIEGIPESEGIELRPSVGEVLNVGFALG